MGEKLLRLVRRQAEERTPVEGRKAGAIWENVKESGLLRELSLKKYLFGSLKKSNGSMGKGGLTG